MVNVGALYLGNSRCKFTVWAPLHKQVAVKITAPVSQVVPMQPLEQGYWQAIADDVAPGARYVYQFEAEADYPDPASRSQPDGVHQPSQVVDPNSFTWTDPGWHNIPLADFIIYELHIGTFMPEGTFEATIARLPRLKELGITVIEIMPVAQFPGDRNWGYDGVYPYAVQHSYGGVDGFKTLVNACHQHGLAVMLDVVYNHVGPEGNYFANIAPYFTSTYRSIWGAALNFDDAYCDGVRNYFLENALYWFHEFHIDALRLDAIQGIYDLSAKHFLAELAERVKQLAQQQGKSLYLIAESDLNDVRVIRPQEQDGFGMAAQWCDDFHHALHTLITGEQQGYYQDFGSCEDLAKSLREGFVYTGQYSRDRDRCHGNSSVIMPAHQFVVYAQNHDQTGNRLLGERLSQLTTFEGLKLSAGAVLLSPFIPLLFMGEEYGEDAAFIYFISHSNQDLIAAIRQSRDNKFKQVGFDGSSYDPQAVESFQQCKLDWEKQEQGHYKVLWKFYQHLIQLRRSHPALKQLDKQCLQVTAVEADHLIIMHRWHEADQVFYLMNFGDRNVTLEPDLPTGSWQKLLDSASIDWAGSGSDLPENLSAFQPITVNAKSFALYQA